jgi:ELWxxDGT repeat protein
MYVEVEVDDQGFSGSGGNKVTHDRFVLKINDAASEPVVNYGGTQLINDEIVLAAEEDTVVKFNRHTTFFASRGLEEFNLDSNLVFSVGHSDAGVDDVVVTVSAASGVVSVGTDYGFPEGSRTDTSYKAGHSGDTREFDHAVSGGGQTGSPIVISGPLSIVNAALKTLSYRGAENWFGKDVMSIEVASQGQAKVRKVYLDVAAVNDYPVVVIEGETTNIGQLHKDPSSWAEIVFEATEDEIFNVDFVSLFDVDNLDLYAVAEGAGEATVASSNSAKQQVLEVELTVSNGVLSLGDDYRNGLEVTSSNGGRNLLLRGLQKNLNAGLKKITYLNDLNWNGDDTLVITATDFGVYTYAAGMPLYHVRNVVFRVAAVNDVPYVVFPKGEADASVLVALEDVGGLIGSDQTTVDDLDLDIRLSLVNGGHPVHYLSSASIYIVDDDVLAGEEITLEVSSAFGSITLRNLPIVSSFLTFEVGDGHMDKQLRVKGEVQHLNTALKSAVYLSDLNFNSEFGHVFPIAGYDSGMEQLTFTVSDESGGTSESVLSVDVWAINDYPVLMTSHDVLDETLTFGDDMSPLRIGVDTLTVKEDVAHKLVGVSVRDVDCKQTLVEGTLQVTVYSTNGKVSVPANSPILQYVSGSGGTLNKVLIFTGSVKNVNIALSDLVYVGDVDYYGTDQLILTVSDLGNNGYAFKYNPTSKLTELTTPVVYSDSVAIPIVVTSEVDAPVITLPNEEGSEYMTFTEDTAGNLVGIGITDVDGNSGDIEVEIYCSRGKVKLNNLDGLAFSVGNGILDKHVIGTGTVFEWNRAISDMTYLPDTQWHTQMRELDEIVVTVSDLGLEDAEGDAGVSTKTLYVEVLAVNDAPEWRVPGQVWRLPLLSAGKQRGYVVDYVKTAVIDEDEELVFENSVYIIDVDLTEADRSDLDSVIKVELDCSFCTITLEGGMSGLQMLDGGNGEGMMRFQGTLKNVNAALSRFVYRGKVDYNGPDTVNFWVSDLGNYGSGTTSVLTATAAIPVTVNPINDSPKWSTPDFPLACPEDKLCKISNVQIVDPDAVEASYSGIFDVTVQADFGSVSFNGIEVPASIQFNWDDDGEGSKKVRLSGSMADINFMLNDLMYSPKEDMTTLNGRGNEVIHLLVSSDGGDPGLTAEGRVMVVIAEGNNDAPIIMYSGATYSGNDEGCQDDDHDYGNDSTIGVLGKNQSGAPAYKKCHRLLSVDILQCKEDIACQVESLYVIDVDAVEVDYHAIEVTVQASNGNLVMPDAVSYELWWDTVSGSGVGGPWPKNGMAMEISTNQHMMKMRGRLEVVNDALSSLYYVSDPHFFGVDSITVTVNDLGFWGSGGAKETVMVIPVYVDAEEDKPVVQFNRASLFASGGSVISATEDEFFTMNGISIVHADSDPAAAIDYVAGLKRKTATFDGSNVPEVGGAGFIRVMIEASNLRFRLSSDEKLVFTVPNITSEEVRRFDNMYYGSGEQLEVEKRSSDGIDLGLVSGAPTILWWNNVTIEGRLVDVNKAVSGLTVLANSNFCSDAECLYDKKLAWVRFNVKSLGQIGDGDVNDEDRVVDWHWEYDDSKTAFVNVGAVNDMPVITIGGNLEEYMHESTNLMESDGLSRVVSKVNWLNGEEELPVSVPVRFRDVDDTELTVNVAATFGYVSLENSESLFFSKGDGEYDTEFEVVGTIEDLNTVFESLKFVGMKDYFGDGGSVTFTVGDGVANKAERTVYISLTGINDPIEMLLGVDSEEYNITYFVDEGEAVRLGGATLVPERFEALSIGVRGNKEYTTKTGFELWRSEGEKGSFDKMGDFTQGNSDPSWGWGQEEEWRGNLVKDIGAGEMSSTPRYFEEFNGLLYFSAEDGVNGRELWRTDGTMTGTVQVKDIFPGKRSSDPKYLTEFNGYLYFSADGIDDTWMINHEHADDCGGFRQDSMNSKVFYAVAETNVWETQKEYDCPFGYHWASTAEAQELFQSAGNYKGIVGESRGYEGKCGWDGKVWGGLSRERFRFSDSRLTGAYKHVGSWDSVRPDVDSAVGGVGLLAQPGDLVTASFAGIVCVAGEPKGISTVFYDECRFDSGIYNSATDASCWARGGRELWRTDGTQEGTKRIGDMNGGGSDSGVGGTVKAGMRGSDPRFLTVVGGNLFFSAESDGESGGRELWISDGTETGASQVKDINDHIKGSDPTDLVECGGSLFFSALEENSGRELWISDGTSGGTTLVKDIRGGLEGSDVKGLVCDGAGTVYFAADDGANGEELWKSDGTSGGTVMVKDIQTGSSGSSPRYIVSWSGNVYFSANDGVSGAELWKSDGTSGNTVMVDDIWIGSGHSYPSFMTVFTSKAPGASSKLFFLANNGKQSSGSGGYNPNRIDGFGSHNNGVQMYVYDGATVERAFTQTFGNVDIDWEGMDADHPADFGVFENTLYYGANFGKRDILVPQGFVDREAFNSYYREFGFDQAWVLWDDDVELEPERVYSGYVNVTKGEVEVAGVGRGSSVEFNGTLTEINMLGRKVVYYPTDGEQGWADLVVIFKDLVFGDDCELRKVCEEMVVRSERKIWITGVNDAPVLTRLGSGGGEEVGVGVEVELDGMSVHDEDMMEGAVMKVVVECTKGRVGVNGRDGVSIDGGVGQGLGWEQSVTFYGTLADVNVALNKLKYLCSSEVDGCAAGDSDMIVVTVNDNGGTGKGGAMSDEMVVQVDIVA